MSIHDGSPGVNSTVLVSLGRHCAAVPDSSAMYVIATTKRCTVSLNAFPGNCLAGWMSLQCLLKCENCTLGLLQRGDVSINRSQLDLGVSF